MAFGVDQEKQLLQSLVNNQSATDKYNADFFDDATSPKYYGFVAKGGLWYIMRETITGTISKFEYTTGPLVQQTIPDYLTAWTGRASLIYTNRAVTKIY